MPDELTYEQQIDLLAKEMAERVGKLYKGFIPMPHKDDFHKWAEQYRAGKMLEDEFFGLVCELQKNGEKV